MASSAELLLRGFSLFKSGKYKEAVHYYRTLTTIAPLESRYWVSLAHILRKTGSTDEAIEAYKVSLLLGEEKEPETLLSLAELLKDKNEDQEVFALLNQAESVASPKMQKHLQFVKNSWFRDKIGAK